LRILKVVNSLKIHSKKLEKKTRTRRKKIGRSSDKRIQRSF
jgi:hypothetical protein